jgi:hypothetical protein
VRVVMRSKEPNRPGSTPIIRLDGTSITYHLWITWHPYRCEMLVLRCDAYGNVLASIRSESDGCNGHKGA